MVLRLIIFFQLINVICGKNASATSTPKPIAVQVTACNQKSSTAYFSAVEYKIESKHNISVNVIGINECIGACTDSISPLAKHDSLNCSSITMTANSTTPCVLHGESAIPDGKLKFKKDNDSLSLQKFCLPTTAPASCFEKLFLLLPKFLFKPSKHHTIHNSTESTLAECAAKCSIFKNCKAGQYDDKTDSCIFYQANVRDFPEDIAKDAIDTQYYFENGCLNGENSTTLFELFA